MESTLRKHFFATDLHGRVERYRKLAAAIDAERPAVVFLGGDLLPHAFSSSEDGGQGIDFVDGHLSPLFLRLRDRLGSDYPAVFLIPGNDDPRAMETALVEAGADGIWSYIHGRRVPLDGFTVYGYACVPPTPFLLKDWERYDVSRYVSPGCISPEEGYRSVPVSEYELKWGTIEKDLDTLAGDETLERAIFLMHVPPYETPLDRAALDGQEIDHVALDVHVGSVAVRRFIEQKQPLVSLHGHVHESARITGSWMTRIGSTVCINGAHDGPELALINFDPDSPEHASRRLL